MEITVFIETQQVSINGENLVFFAEVGISNDYDGDGDIIDRWTITEMLEERFGGNIKITFK